MVLLRCSDAVRERLTRELDAHGIRIDGSSAGADWVLVERGMPVPDGPPAIVFDPLDHGEVVRMLVAGARRDAAAGVLTAQSDDGFTVLTPRDVQYFEAEGDGIVACTASGRFRVRHTLQHYETAWGTRGFLRANRSQLVNLLHVKQIIPWFNSRYVLRLSGGDELEVSKTYAKGLRAALRM